MSQRPVLMEGSNSDSDSLKDWHVVGHGQSPTDESSECDSIEVLQEQHIEECPLELSDEDSQSPEPGNLELVAAKEEEKNRPVEEKTLMPRSQLSDSWDIISSRQTLFETIAILASATILFASIYQSSSVPTSFLESNVLNTLSKVPGHHLPPDGAVIEELYIYEELSNALKLKLKNTDKMISALKDYMNKNPSPEDLHVPSSTPENPSKRAEDISKPTHKSQRSGNFGLLLNFMIFVRDSGLFNEIGEGASDDLTTFETILDLSSSNLSGGNWDRILFRFLENQGSIVHQTLSGLNKNVLGGMSGMVNLFYNEFCVGGPVGNEAALCSTLAKKGLKANRGKQVFSDSIQRNHYENVVRSQNEFKQRRLMEAEDTADSSHGYCLNEMECQERTENVNDQGSGDHDEFNDHKKSRDYKETGEVYQKHRHDSHKNDEGRKHDGYKKNDKKHDDYKKNDKKHDDYKKNDRKHDDYEKYNDYKKHDDYKKNDRKHDEYEKYDDYKKNDKKHDDYKKNNDYEKYNDYKKKDKKHDDYKKHESYINERQETTKPHGEYKNHENFKKDDYKKHSHHANEEYRKNVDYKKNHDKKSDEYKKHDEYKGADGMKHNEYKKHDYKNHDNYKRHDNSKADEYKKLDYNKHSEYKKDGTYYKEQGDKNHENYKKPNDYQKNGEYKRQDNTKQQPEYHQKHFKEYNRPYGNAPAGEVNQEKINVVETKAR